MTAPGASPDSGGEVGRAGGYKDIDLWVSISCCTGGIEYTMDRHDLVLPGVYSPMVGKQIRKQITVQTPPSPAKPIEET